MFAAWLTFPANELKAFGKSLAASSAFSANILFYRSGLGYFAPRSAFQPLLHTWTLSVEEQFYLLWPLLVGVLSIPALLKWKTPTLFLLLIGALGLSAYWVGQNPNAAYFATPSRAWELAMGAILVLPPVSRRLTNLSPTVASVASVVGLLMIGVAVIMYDGFTPFPGLNALLPCAGAALIIASSEGATSIGGRILSWSPFVWIGLISYSLYLWHWPVLVFGRLILNHELNGFERGSLVLLTFLAAWLSWAFVEAPFRHMKVGRGNSGKWLIGGFVTTLFFTALGLTVYVYDGFPQRGPVVSGELREINIESAVFETSPCLTWQISLPGSDHCLLGAPSPSSKYRLVLWGDSHAAQLAPAIDNVGQDLGITAREITKAGCPPLIDVNFFPVSADLRGCRSFNNAVLQSALSDGDVKVVILSARWDSIVDGTYLLTQSGSRSSLENSRKLFVTSLRQTLMSLVNSDRRVVLVAQVPLPPVNLVGCYSWVQFNGGDKGLCEKSEQTERSETEKRVNEALLEASANLLPKVQIVYPFASLCNLTGCVLHADGKFLYLDDIHLSPDGARRLVPDLEKSISMQLLTTNNR